MLKKASTRLIIPELSEDLIANEPWSIESYADGLMDELFADIDYILNVSGNLAFQTISHSSQNKSSVAKVSSKVQSSPSRRSDFSPVGATGAGNPTTPIAQKYVPLQTAMVPEIILPAPNRPAESVVPDNHKRLSTVVFDTATVKPVSRKRQKTNSALGKLLLAGTTLGLAIAGIIYLLQSGVIHLLNTRLTESSLLVPQLPTKPKIEAELVDYMLAALVVIDKQAAKSNQKSFRTGLSSQANTNQTAIANEQLIGKLPPLPVLAANNTPPAPTRSGSFVERIYVPVYQAPSPMRYALPTIPGTPTLLPQVARAFQGYQPNVVKTALNKVQQAAKPITANIFAAAVRAELKPVAARTAPITVRRRPNPLPALPVVPLRAALAPESEPTITQHQVYLPTAIANTPASTLEGLLELGNKSAALFKIEGVTRRINIGENIGSSGWTLVDVSNGEAVIRRNGEVRSIYAGQKL